MIARAAGSVTAWRIGAALALHRLADCIYPASRSGLIAVQSKRRFGQRSRWRLEHYANEENSNEAQRSLAQFILRAREIIYDRYGNIEAFRRDYLGNVSSSAMQCALSHSQTFGAQTGTTAHFVRCRIADILDLTDLYDAALAAAEHKAALDDCVFLRKQAD